MRMFGNRKPDSVDRGKQGTARRISLVVAGLVALGMHVGAANAHHSFAMFDQTKPTNLKGVIAKFEWTNPHAFVILDVPNGKGGKTTYTFECSSPNLMSHQGWKFNTIKAGDAVSVNFYPLRNGKPGGMLATVTLRSGKTLKAW